MDEKIVKRRVVFRRLIQLLILGAIFVMGITPTGNENDFFWQLKMGEDIWERHFFPVIDPYNLSNPGAVWTLEEWPPCVLFYLVAKHFGIPVLILVKSGIVTLTFSLFFLLFNKLKVNFYLSFFVFLMAVMVNTRGIWVIFPSIFEYLFIVLTLFILEYYRKITWKTVVILIILALVWANSHASFFLLTGIVFCYVFGSFMAERLQKRFSNYHPTGWILNWQEQKKLFLAGFISIFTPLLTPNGYWTWLYPFRISFGPFTKYISEYQRYWQVWQWNWNDFVHGFTLILIVIMFLVFIFAVKRLNPIDFLLGSAFTFLSMMAVRHVAVFALVALFIIAKYITVGFGEYRGIFKRSLIKDFLLIIFIISFLYFYKTKIVGFGLAFSESGYPKDAAEFVMNNNIPGNMFNHYNFGGYLIWKMSPKYQVFIDGRLEMYQEQAGIDYQNILEAKEGYQELLNKYRVNFIFFYAADALIEVLMKSENWRLVNNSNGYVILVKNVKENEEVVNKYWSKESDEQFLTGYRKVMAQKIGERAFEYLRQKEILLGVDYLERAVELDPESSARRLDLANGYLVLGWWNEARIEYQKVLELDPSNKEAIQGFEKVNKLEKIQNYESLFIR